MNHMVIQTLAWLAGVIMTIGAYALGVWSATRVQRKGRDGTHR